MKQKDLTEKLLKSNLVTHIICPFCKKVHRIFKDDFNQEEDIVEINCPFTNNQKVILNFKGEFNFDYIFEETDDYDFEDEFDDDDDEFVEDEFDEELVLEIDTDYDIIINEYDICIRIFNVDTNETLLGILLDWIETHKILSNLNKDEYLDFKGLFDVILKSPEELIKNKQECLNKKNWNENHLGSFNLNLSKQKVKELHEVISELERQIEYLQTI